MDSSSLITGLIIMALLLVPFFLYQQKQRVQAKKRLLQFVSLGMQQQVNISQHEFWAETYALGLDQEQQKLIYTKTIEGEEQLIVVSLADVNKCQVVSSTQDSASNLTFDLIELRLSFRNTRKPDKSLEFYNREVQLALNNELVLTRKWSDVINGMLQTTAPASHGVVRASIPLADASF